MIMGFTSKLVSTDGFDWSSQWSLLKNGDLEINLKPTLQLSQPRQQQQGPPLQCPRCNSTNTKFCYYNNYSRSQPRHYCKACRRHWTNGGTLRNVPVGGGHKVKRLKNTHQLTPPNRSTVDNTNTATVDDSNIPTIQQLLLPTLSFEPDIHCQTQLQQSLLSPSDYTTGIVNNNSGSYLGSLLSLPPVPDHFGSTETAPGMMSSYVDDCCGSCNYAGSSTMSSSPTTFFNYSGQLDLAEEDAGVALVDALTAMPWQMMPSPPPCSSGAGTSTTNYYHNQ